MFDDDDDDSDEEEDEDDSSVDDTISVRFLALISRAIMLHVTLHYITSS